MVVTRPLAQTLTLEEFLQLPETQPASEYIKGKIIQKPMPQGKHSTIQLELASAINRVGKPKKIVYAWPELRCTFGDRSVVPDIAVFKWERIPLDKNNEITNRFTTYPDWIVEILSPEQSANQVIGKIVFCLQHGSQLGWLVEPKDRSVTIFTRDRLPEIRSGEDILPVLDCLTNWQLSARELFDWLVF
ncbi:Uma2 family endonuclease [Spirulina sp. 06S082]|uniref:Uma2 family endonuclease n=1 Tax=Spirulina sp. 06S082 TaxID=3110248 RepID=UPI002B1F671C|nr:Uma2 family endonuclease [Spirulina sp. 06S082]MEA5470688.1 Uma2 family endonuclease [Spirulina sp. 06S082]